MLIEAVGEGIKKLDSLFPGMLTQVSPDTNWRGIKGMRDSIAHGYFFIDADIVFDVAVEEFPELRTALQKVRQQLESLF